MVIGIIFTVLAAFLISMHTLTVFDEKHTKWYLLLSFGYTTTLLVIAIIVEVLL